MRKRTLQQVIDAAKSGKAVDPDECREAMLALHSMFTKSRMTLEILAENKNSMVGLFYTARGYLHSPEIMRYGQ